MHETRMTRSNFRVAKHRADIEWSGDATDRPLIGRGRVNKMGSEYAMLNLSILWEYDFAKHEWSEKPVLDGRGARVKKDGTLYNERVPLSWRLNMLRWPEWLGELIEQHSPDWSPEDA